MKVALDIGHLFKRKNPRDKGAFYNGIFEADLVIRYVKKARFFLEDSGFEVYISEPELGILVGDYWERRKWVNEHLSIDDIYLQCHLNAGKGNYGLIICVMDFNEDEKGIKRDEQNSKEILYGQVLGRNITKFLGLEVKDFDEAKDIVWVLERGERGYDIVKRFICPAFIFEPCFLDNPEHFENLKSGVWIDAIARVIWKSCVEIRDKISYI